ncbi:hypothetical protein D3C84_802690 [compost metagenome]
MGEKVPAILMIDEAAEKLLIVRGAQTSAQLFGKGGGRGVFLDRMFGVVRNVRHYPGCFPCAFQVRCKQQDAGQASIHDRQLMTAPGLAAQT